MPTNDFKFTIAVSEQQYITKPKREDNIFTTIKFVPKEVTGQELLNYALLGHAFSYVFESASQDDSFGQKGKTTKNFIATSTIIYDFDNMDVEMYDFIDNLEFKPSFAYTTASNGCVGKGFRYRLGYVFNHPIFYIQDFVSFYYAIMSANGFEFEDKGKGTGGVDKQTISCTSVFFGTNANADTYTSYYNYCRQDFQDFIQKDTPVFSAPKTNDVTISFDKDYKKDFYSLKPKEFINKYFKQFYGNYKASLETPLILDNSLMFFTFPERYVAVLRKRKGGKTYKHPIGSGRLRKIFITAKIMLYNRPSLSPENLLFNLLLEREWYYDNRDDKLSKEVLISTVSNAFKYDIQLQETKHGQFKLNKDYWKEKGYTPIQAVNYVRRYRKAALVNYYFNPSLTYKENVRLLEDNGIMVSERTLKRMVARGDIQINTNLFPHPYLSVCRSDVTNPTTNSILELLKQDGTLTQAKIADMLSLDIRTVKRYFDEMKGVLIERVGNNRTGKWVVKEPESKPEHKPQPKQAYSYERTCAYV